MSHRFISNLIAPPKSVRRHFSIKSHAENCVLELTSSQSASAVLSRQNVASAGHSTGKMSHPLCSAGKMSHSDVAQRRDIAFWRHSGVTQCRDIALWRDSGVFTRQQVIALVSAYDVTLCAVARQTRRHAQKSPM